MISHQPSPHCRDVNDEGLLPSLTECLVCTVGPCLLTREIRYCMYYSTADLLS